MSSTDIKREMNTTLIKEKRITSLETFIGYIKDQIDLYEADLDMTTEEDMASFYQGQLEAYEDVLSRLKSFVNDGEAGMWVK